MKRPTDEQLHVSHFATAPPRTMYIMVDLSDRITTATAQLVLLPQPIQQHVLCKIQYHSDGYLQIEPDFNEHRTPYLIETGNYYNEVYQYYLEHASTPIQTEDLIMEKRILDQIISHQRSLLKPVVGNEFLIVSRISLDIFHLSMTFEFSQKMNFSNCISSEKSLVQPTLNTMKSTHTIVLIYQMVN